MTLPDSGTMGNPQGLEEASTDLEEQIFGPEPQINSAKAEHEPESPSVLLEVADRPNSNAVPQTSTVFEAEDGAIVSSENAESSMECPLRSDDMNTFEEVRLQVGMSSASAEMPFTPDLASSIAEALQSNVTDLPPVTMPTSVSVASIEVLSLIQLANLQYKPPCESEPASSFHCTSLFKIHQAAFAMERLSLFGEFSSCILGSISKIQWFELLLDGAFLPERGPEVAMVCLANIRKSSNRGLS